MAARSRARRAAIEGQRGVVVATLVAVLVSVAMSSASADGSAVSAETLGVDELKLLQFELDEEIETARAREAQIRQELDEVAAERKKTETETEHMNGAKMWEAGEKVKHEKALAEARSKIRDEQQHIAHSVLHMHELEREIAVLQSKLASLNERKTLTERRYYEPSLEDMLDSKSREWSPMSQKLYNKTKDVVAGYEEMTAMQRRVPRIVVAFVFLMLYGVMVGSAYTVYYVFSRVRVTLSKLVLLGDISFAIYWAVACLLTIMLARDPIALIAPRAPRLSALFQFQWMAAYVSYAMLRVLQLAISMALPILMELVCVIVVGQHFYLRVWRPCILDAYPVGSGFSVYYLCYCCLFLAFAFNKLQALSPMQPAGGPSLTASEWLHIVKSRFFEKSTVSQDPSIPPHVAAAAAQPPPPSATLSTYAQGDVDLSDLFANIRAD